jgi:hypothetical protein
MAISYVRIFEKTITCNKKINGWICSARFLWNECFDWYTHQCRRFCLKSKFICMEKKTYENKKETSNPIEP